MDQLTTRYASLMRSYSKLDTLLYGDRAKREKKAGFTNRRNIMRSVTRAEGDFPVTKIGNAGRIPHPT
jgi:hypothetical protein